MKIIPLLFHFKGPTGGRVTVMQTCLPTVGPGALENREVSGDSGKVNCFINLHGLDLCFCSLI